MALGSETKRRVLYYLTMKSQNKDKQVDPHFEVSRRNADGSTDKNLPKEVEVSGKLLKISHREFEFEPSSGGGKRKGKSVSVHLLDGETEYKIEANINTGMGRDLMNKIISTSMFGTIVLRLYENKGGFPNLYVENNGESLGWKYQYKEELAPLVDLMVDPSNPEGDKIKVFTKVNNKLLEDWSRHEPIVAENAKRNGLLDIAPKDADQPAARTTIPGNGDLQEEFNNMPEPPSVKDSDLPPPPTDDLPF